LIFYKQAQTFKLRRGEEKHIFSKEGRNVGMIAFSPDLIKKTQENFYGFWPGFNAT